LQINPGDRVADIGAGRGYFTFRLADAVGPQGTVYAVEVTDKKVKNLTEQVQKKGYTNIQVIHGQFEDPLLPDHSIDLVFCCNTYHHIDDRTAYFARLKTDLTPTGRVAIIDLKRNQTGLAKLLVPRKHSTPEPLLLEEMTKAGYRPLTTHDFLKQQHFIIFTQEDNQPASYQSARSATLAAPTRPPPKL
jgi:ubiquinone/menaquinone biosynthesis C-methylase UbiE